MGLLSKGTPLYWKDSLKHQAYVRQHGIIQFLNIYAAMKDRTNDVFLWGDEVESLLVIVDANTKTVKLSLRGAQILETLDTQMKALEKNQWNAHFLPEYGCFMIEATPGAPYGGYTADLRLVEANMKLRRQMIESMLQANERLMTITTFPLMGVIPFTSPEYGPRGPVADSDYLPDEIISPHPRFATLTRNIRTRRGGRVRITVPLFQDTHTIENIRKLTAAVEEKTEVQPDPIRDAAKGIIDETKEIYMDAMGFGMGACCLQVTFQARNIREARHLYDHLAVLAPIMLALTAATPFQRGRIADIDVRWTVISQAVDDRTPEERGEKPLPSDPSVPPSDNVARPLQRLHKSRYDSISTYISLEKDFHEKYNDLDLAMDTDTYQTLITNGIDNLLSRHIAHLWTRDPLVIYDEHIQLDDEKSSDHFENIQSTNWQTVRFKPPTPGSSTGWRVEFRSMEVQLTDFENAAFTVFIALISRAVLYFDLNFYIPITKSDENLKTAHKRNAVLTEKFYWRKQTKKCIASDAKQDEYELQSIKDIICGTPDHPGLISLVKTYLDMIQCDKATRDQVECYLELIGKRASGELMCLASWLRKYVSLHPSYKNDSILSQDLVYDLLETLDAIAHGKVEVPQLLGKLCNVPHDSRATPDSSDRGTELSTINLLDFSNADGCAKFREALSAHWNKYPQATSSSATSSSAASSSPSTNCGCG